MEGKRSLSGRLTSLQLFQRWGRGVVRAADGSYTVVVGAALVGLEEGSDYAFQGRDQTHHRYGPQFEVDAATPEIPADPASLAKYLKRQFKGCGEVTARKCVDSYARRGELLVLRDLLLKSPWSIDFEAATGRKSVTFKAKAEETLADYLYRHLAVHIGGIAGVRDNVLRHLASWLVTQLPPNSASPVDAAWSSFSSDPYRPIAHVAGYGFVAADAVGAHLRIPRDAPCRLAALVVHAMQEGCDGYGHVWLSPDELRARVAAIDVTVDMNDAVDAALQAGMPLVLDDGVYYLRHLLQAETAFAQLLWALTRPASALRPASVGDAELQTAASRVASGIRLDESQLAALRGVLTSRVRLHTLTAGPGCGKTALMEVLTGLLPKVNMAFCAPTGKAAKVLSQRVSRHGRAASTIHSLLGVSDDGFVHGPDNPLSADVLVVDEASMADLELAVALLGAVHNTAHVIVLGDVDQLPSVSPGSVLRDLLAIQADHHRLDTTHRNRGGILGFVQQIRSGRITLRDAEDLHFTGRLGEAESEFQAVVTRYLDAVRRCGVENVGLLMSRRKGQASEPGWNTTYANSILRRVMNPHGQKVRGTIFHEADRVIIRKNMVIAQRDAEDDPQPVAVVNGDTGSIQTVVNDDKGEPKWLVLALDDGRRLRFPVAAVDVLNHAYALTVHAAQGSEYREVIFVATNGMPSFVNRAVFYTAASRARERLTIIGEPGVLHQIAARPAPLRNSNAVKRLTRMR